MHKSIVLSAKRDPDLVAFYLAVGGKSFSKHMKEALRMAIRPGYVPKERLPDGLALQYPEDSANVKLDVCITAQADADVEQVLNRVRKRQLGFFVKNAMRFYIGRVITLGVFLEEDFTLASNPVPMQVFALNGAFAPVVQNKRPRAHVRRQRPSDSAGAQTRRREPSAVPPVEEVAVGAPTLETRAPSFPTMGGSSFPSMGSSSQAESEVNTKPEQVAKTAEEEEADMLALIEGLLG